MLHYLILQGTLWNLLKDPWGPPDPNLRITEIRNNFISPFVLRGNLGCSSGEQLVMQMKWFTSYIVCVHHTRMFRCRFIYILFVAAEMILLHLRVSVTNHLIT